MVREREVGGKGGWKFFVLHFLGLGFLSLGHSPRFSLALVKCCCYSSDFCGNDFVFCVIFSPLKIFACGGTGRVSVVRFWVGEMMSHGGWFVLHCPQYLPFS